MKILNLLWILSLSLFAFVACDDDDNVTPEPNTGVVPQVAVSFDKAEMSILKNAGEVQIPIVLAEEAEGTVKVTVNVKEQVRVSAAEGIDFDVKEKVITIEKGKKIGYVDVVVMDDTKTETDKTFILEIKNVYGYGKKAEEKQVCEVLIVSNAFIEFEKSAWTTYESAATNEEYKATCRVPLKIMGTLRETASFEVSVTDSTAKEYQHFELVSKKITVNPGDEMAYIELIPTDDNEVNYDRIFSLTINGVEGSNLSVGKANTTCEVTIVSEEKVKTLSFKEITMEFMENETKAIQINLDNAPLEGEEPVTVLISQKIGGNAVIDQDYTLSAKTVTFNAGDKVKYIDITPKDDDEIVDKKFVLELKAPVGATIDTERGNLEIRIKTNDIPYFKSSLYGSNEGTGNNYFPVLIHKALDHDVTVAITLIPKEGTVGTHYKLITEEVTIPAGETEANVCVWLGYTKEYEKASFDLEVTGPENTTYEPVVKTSFKVNESNYRKFFGKYNVTYVSSSSEFSSGKCTLNVEAEADNFMNYLVCTSTDFRSGRTYTQRLKFNPWDNTLAVVHKEIVFPNVGFTGNYGTCNIKLEWTKDRNKDIPVDISSDFKTLTWDLQGSSVEGILYKASDDSRFNTRWFDISSYKMVKAE